MNKSILFSILSFILVLGLIVQLIAMLTLKDFSFSFSYFLDVVSSAPDFTTVTSYIDLNIVSDWGIFNFLRDFLNIFTSVLSFLIFLCVNLAQMIVYVFYFLKAFFFPMF